jgi:hypothetical protein
LGGPPPRKSARSTLAFVKSVLQPTVDTRSRLGSGENAPVGRAPAVASGLRDVLRGAPPEQAATTRPEIVIEIHKPEGRPIDPTVGMERALTL